MNLQLKQLQAIIITLLISEALPQHDPLINRGEEKVAYLGVFFLAIALVIAVWKLSPKVEHAVIFAFALSIVLIGFFLIR